VGGAFIAGYGLARIFVEFFREPDAHLGYLAGGFVTMGMVLSLPMVLAGLWGMWTARPVAFAPRDEALGKA
jgi:phosphatidylglycerol:prolipoprotein diacylglycerol transferase